MVIEQVPRRGGDRSGGGHHQHRLLARIVTDGTGPGRRQVAWLALAFALVVTLLVAGGGWRSPAPVPAAVHAMSSWRWAGWTSWPARSRSVLRRWSTASRGTYASMRTGRLRRVTAVAVTGTGGGVRRRPVRGGRRGGVHRRRSAVQAREVDAARAQFETGVDGSPSRVGPITSRRSGSAVESPPRTATAQVWAMTLVGVGDAAGRCSRLRRSHWSPMGDAGVAGPTPWRDRRRGPRCAVASGRDPWLGPGRVSHAAAAAWDGSVTARGRPRGRRDPSWRSGRGAGGHARVARAGEEAPSRCSVRRAGAHRRGAPGAFWALDLVAMQASPNRSTRLYTPVLEGPAVRISTSRRWLRSRRRSASRWPGRSGQRDPHRGGGVRAVVAGVVATAGAGLLLAVGGALSESAGPRCRRRVRAWTRRWCRSKRC